MKCVNKKGYSVIRIYQMDVWQNKLKKAIRIIIDYHQKNPTNILIGNIYYDNPLYDYLN